MVIIRKCMEISQENLHVDIGKERVKISFPYQHNIYEGHLKTTEET